MSYESNFSIDDLVWRQSWHKDFMYKCLSTSKLFHGVKNRDRLARELEEAGHMVEVKDLARTEASTLYTVYAYQPINEEDK